MYIYTYRHIFFLENNKSLLHVYFPPGTLWNNCLFVLLSFLTKHFPLLMWGSLESIVSFPLFSLALIGFSLVFLRILPSDVLKSCSYDSSLTAALKNLSPVRANIKKDFAWAQADISTPFRRGSLDFCLSCSLLPPTLHYYYTTTAATTLLLHSYTTFT